MPEEIKQVFNIFDDHFSKQLIISYEKFMENEPCSNAQLRELNDKLSEAIFTLIKASGFLYYVDSNQDTADNKELQLFLLKAANYGKSIFCKSEFNFNTFNNFCRDLRIVNAMRNFGDKPRFLTLEEYNSLQLDENDNILKKTMRQLNFKLAFEIAKFLGFTEKDVYLKYAFKKMKKVDVEDEQSSNRVFNELIIILKKLENISYIDIAKKCFKYKNKYLGEKFMAMEKSILIKIPQYLELKDWKNSIKLAKESNDINAINIVLDNIYKENASISSLNQDNINEKFISTLAAYPTIKVTVINYLKKKNKLKTLERYLIEIKDKEELFYFILEKYFKSVSKIEREEILKKLKDIKFEKNEKFDKKFYENYISDLESSLKFKKECLEKNIYSKDETTNFDNSIFETFEKAISKDFELVKSYNKIFNISTRKITILRFKELFKKGKNEEIEKIIEKEGIKNLDISFIKIASMFFENGDKKKAEEYINKENNVNLIEDKVNLLIKLEKYIEAAEVSLKIKNRDKFEEIFKLTWEKTPKKKELRDKLKEIYNKRK